MFDFEKFPRLNEVDESLIKNEIKVIVKHYRSATAREKLHLVLDAVCRHAVQHNDCSLLDHLWNELPSNANHDGIQKWLLRYTTFKYLKDKAGNKKFLGRDEDGNKAYQYDLAGATMPFYDMPDVKKKKDETWSFDVKFDALISKGIKEREKLTDFERFELDELVKAKFAIKERFKAMQEQAENKNEPENNVIEMAA